MASLLLNLELGLGLGLGLGMLKVGPSVTGSEVAFGVTGGGQAGCLACNKRQVLCHYWGQCHLIIASGKLCLSILSGREKLQN